MKPRGREPADIAHELRSPLNAIKAWAHVLEGHLQDAGPEVQRALEGIRTGVHEQVLLIEELLERAPQNSAAAGVVPRSPPTEGAAMTKRKDAQPDISEHASPHPNPQKPDPNKPEMPGGRREDKGEADAANKATRRGER